MTSSAQHPAGWYPDPAGAQKERYWDGETWSQVTRPAKSPIQQVRASSASSGTPSGTLADWPSRVLAALCDFLIWMLPNQLISTLLAGEALDRLAKWYQEQIQAMLAGNPDAPGLPSMDMFGPVLLATTVSLLLFVLYRTVLVAKRGGTLGQQLLGLKVVADGDPSMANVSWSRAVIRAALGVGFGQIPVLNLVNALLPLGTHKKQTLHDMIARTVVIKK